MSVKVDVVTEKPKKNKDSEWLNWH